MPFIRVRGRTPGDPLHEYDVAAAEAAANPEIYEVLDPDPVDTARPPTFRDGVVKARRLPRKRAPKKPGETKTAPTGADS